MQVPAHRAAPAGLHVSHRPSPTSPLRQCVDLVRDDMVGSESILHQELSSVVPAVEAIGLYLAEGGGKRIRPLLTALGTRASGSQADIQRLMCAGEILHLGSLLHDDVVDNGLERRGRPAAHTVHGNPAVILTGDVCLAKAVLIAGEEAGQEATLALARVVTAMAEGEVLQLLHAGQLDLPLERYLDIIDRKSAALISWCAAAGAWASSNTEAAAALEEFGRAVGVAFQITDDVLDYTGTVDVMGKRAGKDLVERKLTLPLLFACQQDPSILDTLRTGRPEPSEVPRLLEQVIATGGPEQALAYAGTRVEHGLKALAKLPPSPHRDALASLAHFLVDRVR